MKLSRIPAGLSSTEKALFYISKFYLIQTELGQLENHWQSCTGGHTKVVKTVEGNFARIGFTCNSENLAPCEACDFNKAIYSEKRKLKAQLSKASSMLVQYGSFKIDGITCTKVEETLTDQLNAISDISTEENEENFKW